MPNNTLEKWEEKTLGEICDIGAGNSAPQDAALFEKGKYPFIRTADVGKIHFGKIYSSNDLLNDNGIKGLKLFKKGTILIPKSGASTFLNHRVKMEMDGYVVSHLAAVKGNNAIVDDDYLLYYLSTIKVQDLIQDQNYPSVNLPIISNIKISLPDLQEQQRIVRILDETFENIEKAKQNALQNLNNAKELFENSLNDIFNNIENSCNFESLQNIYDVINGYSFKSQDFNCNNSIRVVKITNVGVKEFVEEDNDKLPKDFIDKYKNFVINANDIVIALTRTIISSGLKVAIVPKSFDKSLLNQRVACIKSTNKNCGKYLYYYLQTHNVYNYVKSKVNELMQPNLSINDLKNIPIPAVNYEIQNNIVLQLDELQEQTKRLEQIYTQKLKDLDELKQSILQKAFKGEL